MAPDPAPISILRHCASEPAAGSNKPHHQQEQVVEVVKEEETEVVELSQADLQWIGGGNAQVNLGY